jgi:GT2 family glycosyltransferase
MDLSIIIVNWNSATYTTACVASILDTTHGLDYEILVVDNASTDNSLDLLDAGLAKTTVLRSAQNVGFARANNFGVGHARGRYLLFLNPDTRVTGDAIPRLLSVLRSSPTIGAVGCRLLNGDLSVQTSCVQKFPTVLNQLLEIDWLKRWVPTLYGMRPLFEEGKRQPVDVQMVSGACIMMERSTFERIGGFSTEYFLYAEDIDLCYKVWHAGLRVCFVPDAEIIHFGGGSSAKEASGFSVVVMSQSIERFLQKTRGRRYASTYRRAMGATATVRILLLRLALLLPFDKAKVSGPLVKWRRILSWSRGREGWAAQLGVGQPEPMGS